MFGKSSMIAVLILGFTTCAGWQASPAQAGEPKKARLSRLEKKLLGKHKFGVQFIWDGYGTATIEQTPDGLEIRGEQFSKKKKAKTEREMGMIAKLPQGEDETPKRDYVKIRGMVQVVDGHTLKVTGTLDTYLATCCRKQLIEGSFTFKRWGKRRFYRLQDPQRNKLCNKYTCHYYIDLFL